MEHSEILEEPLVECLLEEITDRPIEIEAISNEKVRHDDRPPSPIFVPQPRGIDVSTQVEDSDLFDFDVEVEPILQAIVGNTLEKSLAEVIEEADLEEELQAREVFELVRISERLECERVQLEDVRKRQERARREVENVAREEAAKKSVKKSAASTFAHTYVGDVVSDVFDNLEGAGFFFDPLIRCVCAPVLQGMAAITCAITCASIAPMPAHAHTLLSPCFHVRRAASLCYVQLWRMCLHGCQAPKLWCLALSFLHSCAR